MSEVKRCWDMSVQFDADVEIIPSAKPCGRAALPGPWGLCEQHEEFHRRESESAWRRYTGITPEHLQAVPRDDHAAEVARLTAELADARALAEKDARIAELERALREIVAHEPTVEDHDPTEWGEGECPECVKVREAKWPPSGMCSRHYDLVARLRAVNERHRSYQYLDMRRIARAALARTQEGT